MNELQKNLFEYLCNLIHKKIMTAFKDGAKVAIIVRFDNDPESDVYVSNDPDFDEMKAAVERAKAREVAYTTTLY